MPARIARDMQATFMEAPPWHRCRLARNRDRARSKQQGASEEERSEKPQNSPGCTNRKECPSRIGKLSCAGSSGETKAFLSRTSAKILSSRDVRQVRDVSCRSQSF